MSADRIDREVFMVMATISRNEIPDLPGRIIAATAQLRQVPIISWDRQIRLCAAETVW